MSSAAGTCPRASTSRPSIYLHPPPADVYPEPLAFRPERFLGDDPPGTYEWIPFGGGVRRCLGASFAMFEMRVVLPDGAAHGPARARPRRRVRGGHAPRDHVRALARRADRGRPASRLTALESPRVRADREERCDGSDGHGREHVLARQLDRLPPGQPGHRLVEPAAAGRAARTCARTATTCASHNLYDTEAPANGDGAAEADEDLPAYRTYDGSRQDPIDPRMGMVGSRFGRNAPTDATAPEPLPRADGAEPARGRQPAAAAARVQAGDEPQRARRVLDPVPEPRLVRPRRERARHLHRHRARRGRRVARGHPMRVAHAAPTARGPERAACRRPTSTRSPTGGTSRSSTARPRSATASCARARTASWRSRTGCSRTRPTRSSTAST